MLVWQRLSSGLWTFELFFSAAHVAGHFANIVFVYEATVSVKELPGVLVPLHVGVLEVVRLFTQKKFKTRRILPVQGV